MTLGSTFERTVTAARTGAEWAWSAIYRDLAPSVLGYLRTRGAPDAEDVTGEVFLQVVRDLDSFAGAERDFRAWVFTIAHHRLLDARRHHARRPVEPVGDGLDGGATAPDPADVVLDSLEAERARTLIRRLSPDQQDVILLRTFGELTVEEVARVLHKRPGAIKALQRRAVTSLKKEMSRAGVTL